MKKLEKKDYLLIGTLFIPMVTLIIYLLCKGYIFGSNIDWANQHIVLPEYFRNLFYSNGKIIPSFAFNLGMGQNIFNYSYYGLFYYRTYYLLYQCISTCQQFLSSCILQV